MTNQSEVEEILMNFSNYVVESVTLEPTDVKNIKINLSQATKSILDLITKARIDELENFTYCGASKWEIDDRLNRLKRGQDE